MILYHTSPESKIIPKPFGSDLFGDAIFFSSSVYRMSPASKYVFELNAEQLNIADDFEFESEEDESSWEWQNDIAHQAFNAGYDGVRSLDEQGAVYMMNVKKVHHLMKLENIN